MGHNYPRDDDEPTSNRLTAREIDSVATVEPPADYLGEFPEWRGSVDVVVPREVARAVAHRAGAVAARGKTVTDRTITDYALDHAQIHERFLVPVGSGTASLAEYAEQHGVAVERTEGDVETATTAVTDDGHTRAHFPARAEYRPGDDVPLVVTLDVPDYVLGAAGGFEELTETGRLQLADE